MNSRFFWLTLSASSILTILSLCVLSFPLGIPEEWTWVRIEYGEQGGWAEMVLSLLILLPVALGWLYFVRWGTSRISRASVVVSGLLLTGLWLSSSLLVGTLQSLQPMPFPQLKAWVLYYPQSSGYFHVARYEMEDIESFLSGYEARMAEGDVLHVGTHPPGLFLLHRILWKSCEGSPALTNALIATTPDSASRAFDVLEENLNRSGTAFSEADRASLWLGMILTQAICVATILPVYLLLSRFLSRESAWLATACWPLLPAVSVFLPKSDALYPFIAMLFLWLWVSSVQPLQWWRACAAGLVFWCGALLSLAVVPIGLMAGLYSVSQCFGDSSGEAQPGFLNEKRKQVLRTTVLSAGTFLLATFALWASYHINLFSVWLWNYHNHGRFYEEFSRTAWKWWLVNPLETLFAAGAPLAVTGLWGIAKPKTLPTDFRRLLVSSLLVWGMIWISGKNSGEAARLWLVFFPVVCLCVAAAIESLKEKADEQRSLAFRMLAVQLVICAVTGATVSGFHPV